MATGPPTTAPSRADISTSTRVRGCRPNARRRCARRASSIPSAPTRGATRPNGAATEQQLATSRAPTLSRPSTIPISIKECIRPRRRRHRHRHLRRRRRHCLRSRQGRRSRHSRRRASLLGRFRIHFLQAITEPARRLPARRRQHRLLARHQARDRPRHPRRHPVRRPLSFPTLHRHQANSIPARRRRHRRPALRRLQDHLQPCRPHRHQRNRRRHHRAHRPLSIPSRHRRRRRQLRAPAHLRPHILHRPGRKAPIRAHHRIRRPTRHLNWCRLAHRLLRAMHSRALRRAQVHRHLQRRRRRRRRFRLVQGAP